MKTDVLPIIFLDFETFWADDYTLSKMPTQAYVQDKRFKAHGACIAINNGPIQWFQDQQLFNVVKALHKKYPQAIWVFHNALFDATILSYHYNIRPKFICDTAGISRAIIGPALKKHSLDSVSKFLLGEEKDKVLIRSKNVQTLQGELLEQIVTYCKKDVDLMRRVFYIMAPHFPACELPVMTWVTEMMTQPAIEFDGPMLEKYHQEIKVRKGEVLNQIPIGDQDRADFPKLTDQEIQRRLLMSNPLFAQLLEANGVAPPLKVNAKGQKFLAENMVSEDSLSYGVLQKLLEKKLATYAFAKTDQGLKELLEHENPNVQALVSARLEVKTTIEETRSRTYADLSHFGSICVPLAYSGAIPTHRFSGRDGLNFQNLKRGGVIRNAIIAPEHCAFVVSDLSQIELRITLGLAGHLDAVDLLASGGDLYSDFASDLYGREIRKGRKEDEEQRHIGKEVILGSGFGMGAVKLHGYLLQKGLRTSEEFCKAAIKLYRTKYFGVPKLWKFIEKCYEQLLRDGQEFTVELGCYICTFGFAPILNCPGIKLPNGLWIKYPNLRKEDKQWIYDNDGTEVKIFGGHFLENCLGPDTEVLTPNGWKAIIKIAPTDLLWDGENWVSHNGVVCQGERDTIDFGGVQITPDHKVLVNEQWYTADSITPEKATEAYARSYRVP